MDHSITRRGQPCWYRVPGVGDIAVNDAFMLEGAIYHLLKKHFREEPYYVHLLELFHDVRVAFFRRTRKHGRVALTDERFRRPFGRRWVSWSI